MAVRTFGGTLQARLVIVGLAAMLVATTTLSLLSFLQVRNREAAAAASRLELSARLYSDRIAAELQLMSQDARVLAKMPPIAGLAATAGSDALRDNLARIFMATLETRPHYTQLRFIARAGNWTEVVRVDRSGAASRVVAQDRLQSKGAEPYMAALGRLNGRSGYFSGVTRNREFGKVAGQPTIRFVQPVFDAAGALAGALVVNADYVALLAGAAPDVSGGFAATAVTDRLDHMTWRDGVPGRLHFHADADWTAPDFAEVIRGSAGGSGLSHTGDSVVYTMPVVVKGPSHPFGLYVQTAIPRAELFAPARRALRALLLASGTITLLASLAAGLLGRRITTPLRRLAAAVRSHRNDADALPDLPVSRDEAGELAMAFRSMGNDLILASSRARAFFQGAADGIVIVDDTGRVEDLNPAAETLFGYPAAEIVGQPLARLMPPDIARVHQDYLDLAGDDTAPRIMAADREILGLCRDGTEVPLEISVSRTIFSGRPQFIGIVRDITDRRAAQARMAALVLALEQSNAELDKFAYVASHDLKAPLRVIDNASRWLEEDLQEHLTDDTRESMEMLRGRVARSVRELAGLPAGFCLTVAPGFDAIEIPRMPIEAILLNLVGNAAKHHDRDDGRIALSVSVTDTDLVFTVEDDGPGIPRQYHDKVFEIFQTLRPRDEVDGSGMGLAMVKKHVDVAGGRVTLESDGTRGARFTVVWPKQDRGPNQEIAA